MSKLNRFQEAFLFFAITLGLSYFVFWGPLALFQIPTVSFVSNTMGPAWAIALFIIGGFVPSLVAVILTGIREGREGLRDMMRRMLQLNIGWRWYAAILSVIVIGTLGQLLIIRLTGYAFDLSLFVVQLGSALPLIILGPLSEELGWRGYALDRLQERWSPLLSSLVTGLVWSLWHWPLFKMVGTSQNVLGIPFTGFMVGLMAQSIIYTWLYNNTKRSIWSAILFHWLYTYAGQVIATGVSRTVIYNALEYVPYIIIALGLAVGQRLWRHRSAP